MTDDFIPGIDPEILKMGQEETKAQEKIDAESVKTITDFDQLGSFCSWGLSSKLRIQRGDSVSYFNVPIKSVGVADIIEQYQQNAPRPPSVMKGYQKGSPEALAVGSKIAVLIREVDEANPEYLRMKEKADTEASQMIILSGLAMDLKHPKTGAIVVKGSDVTRPNEILDRDGALLALRSLGMSGTHFSTLVSDIRLLTQDADEAERQE